MKKIAIIHYVNWGGCFSDKWCKWEAFDVKTRDTIDYYDKETIKRSCEEEGYDWVQIRHHKKGNKVTPIAASRSFSLEELKGLGQSFEFTKGIVV